MSVPALPVIASVDMGYGHLRAAYALARELGAEPLRADLAPLAGADEARLWAASRRFYEGISRISQVPVVGIPFRPLLDGVTAIPHLHPFRDLSPSSLAVDGLSRLLDHGLGRGLVELLRETGRPLLTTYFATALAADRAGCSPVLCTATDVDLARVWVARDPAASRIRYLVPGRRAQRRLLAYGVAEERIVETGFPLPDSLLGGPDLGACRAALARRLVRLDPRGSFRRAFGCEIEHLLGPLPAGEDGRSPLLTYAVGGAGAQTRLVRRFLPSLAPCIAEGRLRVALAAGLREEVAERLVDAVRAAGLLRYLGEGVEVVEAADHETCFESFEELLAGTDILWTKPSELTFYAALGLPLVLSEPLGVQERYNRRWAVEHGAGLAAREPREAAGWLAEWLADGTLAGAAWAGFRRLPQDGLYRIAEEARRAAANL